MSRTHGHMSAQYISNFAHNFQICKCKQGKFNLSTKFTLFCHISNLLRCTLCVFSRHFLRKLSKVKFLPRKITKSRSMDQFYQLKSSFPLGPLREFGPLCRSLKWSTLPDKAVPIARMAKSCRTNGTTLSDNWNHLVRPMKPLAVVTS